MKKILFFFTAALLLIVCACAETSEDEPQGIPHTIYFLAPTAAARGGDALQQRTEILDLQEDASPEQIAMAVVGRLLRGSQDGTLLSPFPKGAQMISLTIRNNRAYVDFAGISLLEGIDLTLADYCLTLSLTSIEGIESVSITDNGRFLLQQPRRIFFPYDVLLSSEDSVVQQVQVQLYFLNDEGVLTAEKHTLDIYEGETQSAVLITALLAGPRNSELRRVIPEDFSVNSVKTEDGVCLIHLAPHTLQTLPDDEFTQNMILWTLAESLYSLEYIDAIRFLVDGEELEYFGSVPVASIAERPQG
ncbi:MAG: GerMN domain-containing protein [Oscillospiraceae bacterium]|nr:GerMN domain-containing protein [Oscillospiraceae bacterium]